MATETSTANNPASPGTGGTGNGGAAPTIERMFENVAGSAGEPRGEQPDKRPSEREPQRRNPPQPRDREPEPAEPDDEPEEDEEDPDDLGVDDKSKPKPKEGEEPDEDDEPEEGEDDPEIELDDKGTKAKLSEIKSGYLRQADYTRKTTELGEERKVVYGYAQEMKAERDTLLEAAKGLNALALALQPTEAMWAELRGKPAEFIAAQDAWKGVEAKRAEIMKVARDALQSEANEANRKQALFVQEENRKLQDMMPAIFDPVKGPKIRERIFKYGERMGYTRDQLSQSVDHREIMTLWKAMRYDEIKGSTPDLGKRQGKRQERAPEPVQGNRAPARQAQPARGIVRQNAEKADRRKSAEAALRRSGSIEDAAMVFSNL